MDALLIYPRWDYPTFGELQEPLGLLYIGAALESAGHSVTFADMAVDDISKVDSAIERVELVGMGSSTALYGRACRLLDRIKAARPELPVVLGGPHATVLAEEAVARGFDAAVVGEGEHTAVELLEAMSSGRPLFEVPGVVAPNGSGEVVRAPTRPFEPDLDIFEDADRSLADYEGYFKKNLTHVGMMATRGCPWNCLFCKPMQDKLFGRKIRKRSIRRLVAEMARIEEQVGKNLYIFKDDTFALNGMEWFKEFEQELKAAGPRAPGFSCQSRVDQVTRPLLEQMQRCGLVGVAFGVESGSQRVLDFYRKGIKVEQTIAAYDLCRDMGIGTHAFIMLGAPIETKEDLDETVRLVERIRPNSVSVSVTTPAPGTDLFDYTKKAGLFNLHDPEDSDYHYNRNPIILEHISRKDIAAAEKAILDSVPGTYFRDQLEDRWRSLAQEST